MDLYKIISLFFLIFNGCRVKSDTCPKGEPVTQFNIEDEDDPSVFDDLTTTEIKDVYDYVKGVSEFNVQNLDMIIMNSTYINLIERMPPPKAEVLAFLNSTGAKPARYAKVLLNRGDLDPPVVEEYKVGPLPNILGYERIPIFGKDQLEYRRRHLFAYPDNVAYVNVIAKEVGKVDHILKAVTGFTFNNCTDTCLTWLPGLTGEYKAGDRSVWVFLLRVLDSYYLHPIGFQFRIICGEELDFNNWVIDNVWFRGERFDDMEDLVQNYVIPPTTEPPLMGTGNGKASSVLDHRGDPVPKKKQRGPGSFMPDGRRHTVDGHHIEWQGWKFDFNMRSVIGLQVHDARFKGERIAYELSLSEFGVLYSGVSPASQHSLFTDSQFYFGLETYELVPGIDCPKYATFFDFAHFFNFKPFIFKNSACLFEHSNRVPLRRHYESDFSGGYFYIQGMPGNVLVLRAAITVYNYEYILDYTFHQNGAIEVSITLSGYIISTYYTGTPSDDRYGFEVFPDVLGQIHNHIIHLKADLDIIDTSNRFETLDIKLDEIQNPSNASQRIYIHKFEQTLRETEKDAEIKYNFDTPKYLIFNNNNKKNIYGNKRGYRLYPVNVNKQLLPEGWLSENGVAWTRNVVAVTRQKDSEERAGSIYNSADMVDPVANFQDFIDDNETIVDEDLVAWITLGVFHIPHSEDVPIVQTPGLSLTYFLQPFNFFDEDPSLASRDNVRVTPGLDGMPKYEYAGTPPDVGCKPQMPNLKPVPGSATTVVNYGIIMNIFIFVLLKF